MPLPLTVDSLEKVEENVRGLYKETDGGKFVLDVEGAVPKERLDEFRQNNRTLQQQLDQLKAENEKFADVDLEQYKQMLDDQQKKKDKKLLEEGDVDKIVNERVTKVVEKKDKEIQDRDARIDSLEKNLSTLLIDNEIKDVAIKSGVAESAIPDVVSRGRGQFKVIDGQAVAVDSKGEKVYGDDGVTPLSMTEWMSSLKTNAGHLFKPSKGSDSRGNPPSQRGTPPGSSNEEMTSQQKISQGLANRSRGG